jgi:hypothetical protein
MFVVLLLLCLVASPVLLRAQLPALDPCSAGLSYIIAFPDTTQNVIDERFIENLNYLDDRFYVFLYSSADSNRVSITPKGSTPETIMLEAGKFTELSLIPKRVVNEIGKVSNLSYRIDAEEPILIYCYMATKFGGEMWTPTPVESWGMRYYATAIPPTVVQDILKWDEVNFGEREKISPAVLTVIAAYDSTRVVLTPNVPMLGTNTIMLNAGQVYQYETIFDWPSKYAGRPQPDPGGTLITADKPIAVISTNTRSRSGSANVMLSENSITTMLAEWLTPAEQHGTEFVYLPTWDSRRVIPGDPSQRLDELRQGEFVRIFGTSQGAPTSGTIFHGTGAFSTPFSVNERAVYQTKIDTPRATYIKTARPAQVTMHSSPASHFDSTFGLPGGYTGIGYTGWGPYMTTLIPREQWISFIPFRAPIHPFGMEHYVNVVAAAAAQGKIFLKIGTGAWQPFVFNRGAVGGSDLVWGTMRIGNGVDYYLRGDNDARFSGHVYGFWRGYERFQPGKTKKKDDGNGIASGGGSDADQIMHPAEYFENISLPYGYPLAFSHCAVVPPGIKGVDTSMGCSELTINVQLVPGGAGVHSIVLDPFTTQNARLIFIRPDSATKLLGYSGSSVEVRVVPIDSTKDAQATVLIQDRSRLGKVWRVQYRYTPERVVLNTNPAGEFDFGNVLLNNPAQRQLTIINPTTGRLIEVRSVRLIRGDQSFTVKSSTLPDTLKKDSVAIITLESLPTVEGQFYYDTLVVTLGCSEVRIPLRTRTIHPCITVGDLDFRTLDLNESKTLPLEICNFGSAPVTFFDSTGAGFITWLETHFTADPADLAALKTAVLDSGECITVRVTFRSSETGVFATTARVWASSRNCNDTSIWTAVVTRPGPNISGVNWHERWLATRNQCTKSGIAEYDSVIMVSNTGQQPFTVQSIELIGADATAGYFRLGAAPSIPPGTVIQPGASAAIPQQVIFTPDAERSYICTIRLRTTTGDSTDNVLNGIGIESHVRLTDVNFGTNEFRGAGTTSISGMATLTALPSRPLTVRELRLSDPANFAFDLSGGFVPPVAANPATWWLLNPGESRNVPLLFTPQDSGTVNALLMAVGDHSACDDSTSALTGITYGLSVRASKTDFGVVLSCVDSTGEATLINLSRAPVKVTNIILNDATGAFSLNAPGTPDTLDPGATLRVPVTFAPGGSGNYTATVAFIVTNIDGTVNLGTIEALLTGVGDVFSVNAAIARTHHEFPGIPITIPVRLDEPLDRARVSHLQFSLTYNAGIMQLTNGIQATIGAMLNGTLLAGWAANVTALSAGRFEVDLTAPAGTFLQGTGDLLRLNFTTYAGSTFISELPFSIDLPETPCATVIPSAGLFQLDSVCGMHLRLIESFGKRYALDAPTPNPVTASADIRFSLGLDGATTLTVYNALGQRVATLVNGYMQPGTYQVTWDVGDAAAGLYYYRLVSGVWSKTGQMIIRK